MVSDERVLLGLNWLIVRGVGLATPTVPWRATRTRGVVRPEFLSSGWSVKGSALAILSVVENLKLTKKQGLAVLSQTSVSGKGSDGSQDSRYAATRSAAAKLWRCSQGVNPARSGGICGVIPLGQRPKLSARGYEVNQAPCAGSIAAIRMKTQCVTTRATARYLVHLGRSHVQTRELRSHQRREAEEGSPGRFRWGQRCL